MAEPQSASAPEVDVVAMPSLRADGTPDQTPGYKILDADGAAQDPDAQSPADTETPPESPGTKASRTA